MKKIINVMPSVMYGIILLIFVLNLTSFYVALVCGMLILVPVVYEFIKYIRNYKGPLNISTPDGSKQPYHPSVLYFEGGWCGYKYWMAYTPFPIGALPYRDRWEYPCICASNDGVNWNDINDEQPLDDLTMNQIQNRDYFSDTHLVYNLKENRIECYYRLSEEKYSCNGEKGVWLFRRYSYDGKNWSEREVSVQAGEKGPHGNAYPCISPAIIRQENYQMWYVVNANQHYLVYYATSKNGIQWENSVQCQLKGYEVNPWHIDCQYYDDKYYILAYDFSQKLTLWSSEDGIIFNFEKIILKASHRIGDFYRTSLYRSCMLRDGENYKVYFSAGNERKVKIGLMRGKELHDLSVCNASKNLSMKDFIFDYFEKYFFIERWGIWKLKGRLGIRRKEWF